MEPLTIIVVAAFIAYACFLDGKQKGAQVEQHNAARKREVSDFLRTLEGMPKGDAARAWEKFKKEHNAKWHLE